MKCGHMPALSTVVPKSTASSRADAEARILHPVLYAWRRTHDGDVTTTRNTRHMRSAAPLAHVTCSILCPTPRSVTMPSSFAVYAGPHSFFSLLMDAFSASSDAERASRSRFAKCCV